MVLAIAARARPRMQLALCLFTAAATAGTLPGRLWKPQLKRLGLFTLLLFVMTALGAGAGFAAFACCAYRKCMCGGVTLSSQWCCMQGAGHRAAVFTLPARSLCAALLASFIIPACRARDDFRKPAADILEVCVLISLFVSLWACGRQPHALALGP